jgi:hypothetical protein
VSAFRIGSQRPPSARNARVLHIGAGVRSRKRASSSLIERIPTETAGTISRTRRITHAWLYGESRIAVAHVGVRVELEHRRVRACACAAARTAPAVRLCSPPEHHRELAAVEDPAHRLLHALRHRFGAERRRLELGQRVDAGAVGRAQLLVPQLHVARGVEDRARSPARAALVGGAEVVGRGQHGDARAVETGVLVVEPAEVERQAARPVGYVRGLAGHGDPRNTASDGRAGQRPAPRSILPGRGPCHRARDPAPLGAHQAGRAVSNSLGNSVPAIEHRALHLLHAETNA